MSVYTAGDEMEFFDMIRDKGRRSAFSDTPAIFFPLTGFSSEDL